MTDYIAKPFSRAQIEGMLSRHAERLPPRPVRTTSAPPPVVEASFDPAVPATISAGKRRSLARRILGMYFAESARLLDRWPQAEPQRPGPLPALAHTQNRPALPSDPVLVSYRRAVENALKTGRWHPIPILFETAGWVGPLPCRKSNPWRRNGWALERSRESRKSAGEWPHPAGG